MKRCQFCKKEILDTVEYYTVEKAVKPPKQPFRWKAVGFACKPCGDKQDTKVDPWNQAP